MLASLPHKKPRSSEAADIRASSNGLAAATITYLTHRINMASDQRLRVFLDVNIGEEPAGRLTIELFADQTPKTCEKYGSR